MNLTPYQKAFFENENRFVLSHGGGQCHKTISAIDSVLAHCVTTPNAFAVMLSSGPSTAKYLSRRILDRIPEVGRLAGVEVIAEQGPSRRDIFLTINGQKKAAHIRIRVTEQKPTQPPVAASAQSD